MTTKILRKIGQKHFLVYIQSKNIYDVFKKNIFLGNVSANLPVVSSGHSAKC